MYIYIFIQIYIQIKFSHTYEYTQICMPVHIAEAHVCTCVHMFSGRFIPLSRTISILLDALCCYLDSFTRACVYICTLIYICLSFMCICTCMYICSFLHIDFMCALLLYTDIHTLRWLDATLAICTYIHI